ncbi:Fe-S cluster assembly protein SufD [Hyphomicrobium sp.]|uniref:Fe-S cluster assembly protein SufD n=1 Tax=Hyphomicrobium sp. TaxID=82 RepID=UPI0025BD9DF1|nr:Fe-S cluster assembly protein SufD [Hyphomicrobium sp.]
MQRDATIADEMQAAAGMAQAVDGGAHATTTSPTQHAPGRREMNVAVLKTKTEQGLSEAFGAAAAELPGGAEIRKLRLDAMGRFGSLGLPHRRIEAWKYTDLRGLMKDALPPPARRIPHVTHTDIDAALGPLAAVPAHRVVFVDGQYAPDLSALVADGAVSVASLATLLKSDTSAAELLDTSGRDDDAVLALNTAYAADGAVIDITPEARLDRPLLIVSLRAAEAPGFVATRNVVRVGEGAEASLIEAFVTLPTAANDFQLNTATKVIVGKGAKLAHFKCTLEAGGGVHLANWLVELGPDADYRGFHFTSGTALARNQIGVSFAGTGGNLDLSGAFLGRGGEHIDTTLLVDHAVPGCTSRELFKGVLDGHARGIFQGKVIVRPDAQKTDGKQMAQVLMLSPDCEFDSKPELEIYADDVVCGHGSTSADLDEDLLFYCRARGIPEQQARALLIESFIGEALEKVECEDLRAALTELARAWLHETAPAKGVA